MEKDILIRFTKKEFDLAVESGTITKFNLNSPCSKIFAVLLSQANQITKKYLCDLYLDALDLNEWFEKFLKTSDAYSDMRFFAAYEAGTHFTHKPNWLDSRSDLPATMLIITKEYTDDYVNISLSVIKLSIEQTMFFAKLKVDFTPNFCNQWVTNWIHEWMFTDALLAYADYRVAQVELKEVQI